MGVFHVFKILQMVPTHVKHHIWFQGDVGDDGAPGTVGADGRPVSTVLTRIIYLILIQLQC